MAHRNARLTLHGRLLLCRRIEDEGWLVTAAAEAAGVSRQTASKWRRRLALEGPAGLADRSSARRRPPQRIGGALLRRIVALRLRLRVGPHWIGWLTGAPRSSVYAVLRRLGLSRLRALEPREPVVRYCWPRAGDLVHLDTKKLGRIGPGGGWRFVGRSAKDRHRGIGWNVVHVAVDDATRLAYAEELPDELGTTTAGLPGARPGLLRGARDRGAAPAHRQRQPYRSRAFRAVVEDARPPAPAHAALPAADQRQGGGVREARAERLGLPAALRERGGTHRGPRALPRLLQSLPTPWRSRRPHADAASGSLRSTTCMGATASPRTRRRRSPSGGPSRSRPTRSPCTSCSP